MWIRKQAKLKSSTGRRAGRKAARAALYILAKRLGGGLWRYLVEREDGQDSGAPLFLGKFDQRLNRDALRQLLSSLGEKAGVKKCHPHRFRHTFAITFLRYSGDVFTLQPLLGHSTLEIVQRYTRIAQTDVEQSHRRASPADNWRL